MNTEKDYLGFYELIIPEVHQSDAGTYACRATNKYGQAECEAHVTICEDKNIFGENDGKILPAGEQPVFHWKRNGVEFDPEERFRVLLGDDEDSLALVFQHVKPEDAGLYTCVAQTSTGNISCSAELTVQGAIQELLREPEKPQLIIEHKEAFASIGGTVMIELQCKGYPKPNIEMKHEGVVIEASSKYKFLHEDAETMSLVIKDVQPEDAGNYSVTATNEMGEDKGTVNLQVKCPPKIKKITDYTVKAGEKLSIDIEVTGNPAPNVKILNNGKEVIENERIKIVRSEEVNSRITHTLVISKTELIDAGSYSVIASNELNQTSEFWNVTVNAGPKVVKKLEREYVHGEKEEIIMSVRVDAFPEPTVKWFREGRELSENDSRVRVKRDGNAYILSISGAVRTDGTTYSVEVENCHGKVTDETRVHVKCSPEFKANLKSLVITEGDTNAELFVKVQGYPK